MNIRKATAAYEAWLAKQTNLVKSDIALKHRRMSEARFPFLRATFYRWVSLWPEICPTAADAPAVLAVGDLHIENFGTWRDAEGRLIWGVNDFDEAYRLPYTFDLVRLAASARMALADGHLKLKSKDACEAILAGYTQGLTSGGHPLILEEQRPRLRKIALNELRDPVQFWKSMDGLPRMKKEISPVAREALVRMLPEPRMPYRVVRRTAGLGSLGHERFVALAEWRGGRLAREAKALAPSACQWADGKKDARGAFYHEIIDHAVRVPDPFVELRGDWLVRRLAPDCSRIALADLPRKRDESHLLFSMGLETANIHLGSGDAVGRVRKDLKARRSEWLRTAAKAMVKAINRDWRDWRAS